MTSRNAVTLALSAGLGAVAGMRSMTAPALLSRRLARGGERGHNLPARLLSSDLAARVLPALAIGELVADKLPFVPARTDPPALLGRMGSGALCGAAVAGWRGGSATGAALAGALGALGATYLFYHLRKAAGEATGVPDPALALAEDAVALAAGAALAGAAA